MTIPLGELKLIELEKTFIAKPNEIILNKLVSHFSSVENFNKCASLTQFYLLFDYGNANQWYNFSYYLKKCNSYQKSINSYKISLSFDIEHPEEVYLNIAVIYTDFLNSHDAARVALLKAIECNPSYIPALYNLANLYEDIGEKKLALTQLKRILQIDNRYIEAAIRVVNIDTSLTKNNNLITQLSKNFGNSQFIPQINAEIGYALGHFFDRNHDYATAFKYFKQANYYNGKYLPVYNENEYENYIDSIINLYNSDYFENFPVISTKSVTFICGMFRSGSTLIEQILNGHSKLQSGGELEFYLRFFEDNRLNYPYDTINLSQNVMLKHANDYIDYLRERFTSITGVIDKRPDNFIYLGLIKAMFPNAKFIHTVRQKEDNALSIYFLQLGNKMTYSTQLDNINHYYEQHFRLMEHWKRLFPNNIHTVHYEDVIKNPTHSITNTLAFLDCEWEDDCLNFFNRPTVIKTASVWQVRQPLYSKSVNRYKNYKY